MDEWTRECLAIEVASSITAVRVIAVLERLFQMYGAPQVLRSDNGPEFIARVLKVWTMMNHSETATIAPGQAVAERQHRESPCDVPARVPGRRVLRAPA